MKMEALTEEEQEIYDNIDTDVAEEKTVWLTSLVSDGSRNDGCCRIKGGASWVGIPPPLPRSSFSFNSSGKKNVFGTETL